MKRHEARGCIYLLWSYRAVKVLAVTVETVDEIVPWLYEVEDDWYEDEAVVFMSILLAGFFLTLRSIKSEIKAGFDMFLSLTRSLPVSMSTTEDMDGRTFGSSWVQRRPIFRNLQASSASKSPFSDSSTSVTSSFRW